MRKINKNINDYELEQLYFFAYPIPLKKNRFQALLLWEFIKIGCKINNDFVIRSQSSTLRKNATAW